MDVTGLEIGDTIRSGDVALPRGAELSAHAHDVVVASVAPSSAQQAEAATEDAAAAEAQEEEKEAPTEE